MPLLLFFGLTVRRGKGNQRVALTFDDGPDPDSTPALLAALAAHELLATFFCPAERLLAHPTLAQAMVKAGHELANHSYAHRWSLALWSEDKARRDLSEAQAVLRRFGKETRFFARSPASAARRFCVQRTGSAFVTVTWTARAFDGTRRVSPKTALRRLMPALVAGGIVMLHDRKDGSAAEVIAPLLAAARTRGLSLTQLSGRLTLMGSGTI